MMKKIYFVMGIVLTSFISIKAQDIKALSIGDMMPDLIFGKTVPVANSAGSIADHRDKLLIIDLWATTCSSCIALMPKFEQLQKSFGNSLRIIPVTPEQADYVNDFWKKNRYTKNTSLSSVTEDRALHSYFPHKSISHDIWIYKGKVIAITAPDYVNAENIQKVLDGKPVELPLKNDYQGSFDGANRSAFDSTAMPTKNFMLMKYAFISNNKKGINPGPIINDNRSGIIRDSATNSIRSYIINQPIYISYLWALFGERGLDFYGLLGSIFSFEKTRVVWEVADRTKYMYNEYSDEWNQKNCICYESVYPDTGQTDPDCYRQIAKDMNELFGLDVRFEKRKVKVLVLTRTSQTDLLKTKNPGIDRSYNNYKEGDFFRLRDTQLEEFITEFNRHYGNAYALNETRYTNKVDIDLDIPSWTDISSIRKELAKYGLGFKEETREVEQLIFTETGGGIKQKL